MIKVNFNEIYQWACDSYLPVYKVSEKEGEDKILLAAKEWLRSFEDLAQEAAIEKVEIKCMFSLPPRFTFHDGATVKRVTIPSHGIELYYKDNHWYSPRQLELENFRFFTLHTEAEVKKQIPLSAITDNLGVIQARMVSVDGIYHTYEQWSETINIYEGENIDTMYTTAQQLSKLKSKTLASLDYNGPQEGSMSLNHPKALSSNQKLVMLLIRILQASGNFKNQSLYKDLVEVILKFDSLGLLNSFKLFQCGYRYTVQPRTFYNIPSFPDYSLSISPAKGIIELLDHHKRLVYRLAN